MVKNVSYEHMRTTKYLFPTHINTYKNILRNLERKKKTLRKHLSCNCFEAEVKLWIIRENVLVSYPVGKTLFNISTFARPSMHTHAQHSFFLSWYSIVKHMQRIL